MLHDRRLHAAAQRSWWPVQWARIQDEALDDNDKDVEERASLLLRSILATDLAGNFALTATVAPDDPHVHEYNDCEDLQGALEVTVTMDHFNFIPINSNIGPAARCKRVRCYMEQPCSPPIPKCPLNATQRLLMCWVPLYTAGIHAKHIRVIEGAPYAAVWMNYTVSKNEDGKLEYSGPTFTLVQEDPAATPVHTARMEGGMDDGGQWAPAPPPLRHSESDMDPFIRSLGMRIPLLRYLDPMRLPPAWRKQGSVEDGGLDSMARQLLATTLAHRQYCVLIPPELADRYVGPRLYFKPQYGRNFINVGDEKKKPSPAFSAAQTRLSEFLDGKKREHTRLPEDLCVAPVFFEYPVSSMQTQKMGLSSIAGFIWMPCSFVREGFAPSVLADIAVIRLQGEDYARCELQVKPFKDQTTGNVTWSTHWWLAESGSSLRTIRGLDDNGYALPPLAHWIYSAAQAASGQLPEPVKKSLTEWHDASAGRSTIEVSLLRESLSCCVRSACAHSGKDMLKWVRAVTSSVNESMVARIAKLPLTPAMVYDEVLRPVLSLYLLVRMRSGQCPPALTAQVICAAKHGHCGAVCGKSNDGRPYIDLSRNDNPLMASKAIDVLCHSLDIHAGSPDVKAILAGFLAFLVVWLPVASTFSNSYGRALLQAKDDLEAVLSMAAPREQPTTAEQDLSWVDDLEDGEAQDKGGKQAKKGAKGAKKKAATVQPSKSVSGSDVCVQTSDVKDSKAAAVPMPAAEVHMQQEAQAPPSLAGRLTAQEEDSVGDWAPVSHTKKFSRSRDASARGVPPPAPGVSTAAPPVLPGSKAAAAPPQSSTASPAASAVAPTLLLTPSHGVGNATGAPTVASTPSSSAATVTYASLAAATKPAASIPAAMPDQASGLAVPPKLAPLPSRQLTMADRLRGLDSSWVKDAAASTSSASTTPIPITSSSGSNSTVSPDRTSPASLASAGSSVPSQPGGLPGLGAAEASRPQAVAPMASRPPARHNVDSTPHAVTVAAVDPVLRQLFGGHAETVEGVSTVMSSGMAMSYGAQPFTPLAQDALQLLPLYPDDSSYGSSGTRATWSALLPGATSHAPPVSSAGLWGGSEPYLPSAALPTSVAAVDSAAPLFALNAADPLEVPVSSLPPSFALTNVILEALEEQGTNLALITLWIKVKAGTAELAQYAHLSGPDPDGSKTQECEALVRTVLGDAETSALMRASR